MSKYREKPKLVDAQQFLNGVKPYPEGVVEPGLCQVPRCSKMDEFHIHRIDNYASLVNNEDFVIKQVDGDFNILGPKLFLKFYERDYSE